MTDKQTIIDGVDVAGCKYFNRFRNICHNKNLCCDCEKNQDCYFKQLARKTKECVKLNNKIIDMNSIIEDAAICKQSPNCYYKQLQRKEQECEVLKSESFTREELITLQEKDINRYKQALEPFEDEYFKGLDTKQIAELAKKSIRLTTENRKLENKLSDIAGICEQILDGEDYVRRIAKTILDIID